jgi:hypothetical protein
VSSAAQPASSRQEWSSSPQELWIRSLDALESHVVEGTECGSFPFRSPDGRHVGFFAHGKLKTIDVLGGPSEVLCDAPNPRGGTWSRTGVIVFAPDSRSGLVRVPATGGSPSPATMLDPAIRAGSHRWPQFLPDGRHFLYLLWSGQVEKQGTYVGSLDSRNAIRVSDANSSAAYVPPGYLLFVRDENVMAQTFDVARLTLSGHPVSVAGGVGRRISNYAPFSASEHGALAYSAVDETLMACPINIHDRTVASGTPTPLFHPTLRSTLLRNHYDVSPDGQRFLINTPVQDETTAPVTVVLNWASTLRK